VKKLVLSKPTRCLITLCGRGKTGKSTTCLTGPDPLLYLDFNIGLTSGNQLDISNRDIQTEQYFFEINNRAMCTKVANKFDSDFRSAVNDTHFKTICIDTMGELKNVIRMHKLGTLGLPKESFYKYAEPNAILHSYYDLANESDKNFIFVHHAKPEYIDNTFTGNYVGDYDEYGINNVFAVVWNHVDYDKDGTVSRVYHKIESSRYNIMLAGTEIEFMIEDGDLLLGGFPGIAAELTRTDPGEWRNW